MSLLISAENFLRTRNLHHHTGTRTYGMGYRPVSKRNVSAWGALPRFTSWLQAKGASAPSGDENKVGTTQKVGNTFDQNQVGACTSESSCKAGRISILTKYDALPGGIQDFSQRIMYGQTRQIEAAASVAPGDPIPDISDSGCEPADCITALSNFGLAPMEAPVGGYYNDVWAANVNQEIVLADEEKTLLLPGAHTIDLHNDPSSQWKAMVDAGLGGTLALFVDTQNFMAYDGSAPIQQINLSDPQGGGHQVCGPCYWYTSSSLGLVLGFKNSWGDWGSYGYGEITLTCLMTAIDASLAFDISLQPSSEVA